MKKVLLMLLVIVVISVAFILIVTHVTQDNKQSLNNKKIEFGVAHLDGNDSSGIPVYFINDRACISLLHLLQELGGEIEINSDNTVFITLHSGEYILDINNNTLKNRKRDINILCPAFGSSSLYCDTVESNFVVDIWSLAAVLLNMGYRVQYDVDSQSKIIEITSTKLPVLS